MRVTFHIRIGFIRFMIVTIQSLVQVTGDKPQISNDNKRTPQRLLRWQWRPRDPRCSMIIVWLVWKSCHGSDKFRRISSLVSHKLAYRDKTCSLRMAFLQSLWIETRSREDNRKLYSIQLRLLLPHKGVLWVSSRWLPTTTSASPSTNFPPDSRRPKLRMIQTCNCLLAPCPSKTESSWSLSPSCP